MACAICQSRRPRRFCPGLPGDICSICCGTQREVTVRCPLDCEFLREARKHEQVFPAGEIPNRDIEVRDELLQDHEELLAALSDGLAGFARGNSEVTDRDARDALDALIRTYRTLESGIYYESRPDANLAGRVFDRLQYQASEFRKAETERLGMPKTRDAAVLGVLVFLRRYAWDQDNGRPLGRAFLDALRQLSLAEEEPAAPPASSLILP